MQVVKKGVFGGLFSRAGEPKMESSSFMDPDMVDSPAQSEAEGDTGVIMGQAPSGTIDLASGRPAPQPQALGSRLGGWLSNATTAAGTLPLPCVNAIQEPISFLGHTLRHMLHYTSELSRCVGEGCEIGVGQLTSGAWAAGSRLGVAAQKGATAIQRLSGAEKFQDYHEALQRLESSAAELRGDLGSVACCH